MLTEKRWLAVPNQPLLTDGGVNGVIMVADTTLFKVKQVIYIQSDAIDPLKLEIKQVLSATDMRVGNVGGPITGCVDVSAYLQTDNAFIWANEQKRSSVPVQEIERYIYEEEPSVYQRVGLHDQLGNAYNAANPLPVDATVVLDITAKNVIIDNILSPTTSNTEFSYSLPTNTKWFRIQTRENAVKSRYAFISGNTADGQPYITIKAGSIRTFETLDLSGKTIYLQSNRESITYELEIWTT